jgi:ribosome-binding factor A
MPKEFSRSQRMAEQIRRDLAEIVRDELHDPRMGFLSFTAVKLSRDLSNAVIYCSVMDETNKEESLQTLNRAAGFLRSCLAARIRARTVPTLKFIHDDSVTRGAAMEDLIRKAVRNDEDRSDERNEINVEQQDDEDRNVEGRDDEERS